MTVLVTGGAGYIGSHVVRLLRERGDSVVVVDDLVTGVAERIVGAPLVQMDLSDSRSLPLLEATMLEHDVHSVMHFAGRKQVPESINKPAWYYLQNIGSLANVLLAMEAAHVPRLVFSSSAAVYGSSEGLALRESAPTRPINPYGQSKLAGEWLVEAAVIPLGLRASSLRYFNVAGAGWPDLGDTAVLNLVPLVFERLSQRMAPHIFGGDYPTPDGTCIRDYVHVLDLAEAHLATLDSLGEGPPRHEVFNVGTGLGSSVRMIIDEILAVSGIDISPVVLERRTGDPSVVVADPRAIAEVVGWAASRGLTDIVNSAWNSHEGIGR